MKQTAVEWLVKQFELHYNGENDLEYSEFIEQAKQMDKEQHGKTWDAAIDTYIQRGENFVRAWEDFTDWYNETYGSKGSDETLKEN